MTRWEQAGFRGKAEPVTLTELLEALDAGERIEGGSPLHEVMHRTSQEALRITGELTGRYHEPARGGTGTRVRTLEE